MALLNNTWTNLIVKFYFKLLPWYYSVTPLSSHTLLHPVGNNYVITFGKIFMMLRYSRQIIWLDLILS